MQHHRIHTVFCYVPPRVQRSQGPCDLAMSVPDPSLPRGIAKVREQTTRASCPSKRMLLSPKFIAIEALVGPRQSRHRGRQDESDSTTQQ